MKRRILSLTLVLLLVSSAGVSPIAPAAAADTSCGTLEAYWYDTINIGNWKLLDGGCNEDVQRVEAQENLQQKVDLNQMGRDAQEGRKPLFVKINNTLEQTDAVVSMKARARMVELMNNGTTDATTIRNEVHEVINDYYAVRQANLLETYNAHLAQTAYMLEATTNDADIANDFVYPVPERGYQNDFVYNKFLHTNETSVSLVNGTQHNVSQIWYDQDDVRSAGTSGEGVRNFGAFVQTNQVDIDDEIGNKSVRVRAVSDSALSENVSDTEVINFDRYETLNDKFKATADRMRSNYDLTFIDSVVASYESGEVNTSDMVTPEMMVQEFGAARNETGFLGYQYAMASYMGLPVADMNSTASISIEADSATVVSGPSFNDSTLTASNYSASGLLFAQPPSGSSFSVGSTYSVSNLTGPVWFIDGSTGRKVELSGSFTLTSATGRDGSSLSEVTMTNYNPQTYDSSEFVNSTRQTVEIRKVIEKHYQTSGAGSSGDSGIPKKHLVLVVVLLAALGLAGRGDS